ncbi:glycoside hydrolase [Dichomitus squalens]|uniref:chitinase n=1 Tax=Dichomitus squalens TaxID=114155 RepID=A0A4Q9PMJ4_9APHY|nr:glycoside hydrolase [Dichomitus squalens]TBU55457.1 glycoside hydrolase [Dichomitus squalens]
MAFDMTKNTNLAVYWGQDGDDKQQSLSHYCQDDTIDTIPLAFLYQFKAKGGMPAIDFANTCSASGNSVFAGTALANCDSLADDIKTCQKAGKIVTLSIGGATGEVGFSSDSEAKTFADTIWNLFLGGESPVRPLGDAILDGVDLDIESGSPAHYAAFVNRIRSNAGENTSDKTKAKSRRARHRMLKRKKSSPTSSKNSTEIDVTTKDKKYYITAAPQCPYPDANIGEALNEAHFDAVYVQFYNNYCGLNHKSDYNFATWDNWAKTKSANPDVKVYIGAPASSKAAGEGYVSAETLASYVAEAQQKYSSFGGVMLWDADTAYNNNRFDKAAKNGLTAN